MASLDAAKGISLVPSENRSEILSETEINALLKEAETRLREAQKSQALVQRDTVSAFSKLPKLKAGVLATPYLQEENGIVRADPAKLVDSEQRKLADDIYVPQLTIKPDKKKAKETAGEDWFDMPKTDLTPQLKRDLQILQMRSVLDPHRHYKGQGSKGKVPAFSQTGTVIEGPTEYYSARLNKRDRKQTFAEEVMDGERKSGHFKRKYTEIQEAKKSGKKAYYKKLKEQRKRNG